MRVSFELCILFRVAFSSFQSIWHIFPLLVPVKPFQHTQKMYNLWNHDSLFSVGSLIKTKQFQEEVLKFFVVLWRYMVFQFPIRSACLFEQIYPVLTNVYRRPRSNFWDHSQLFRTNGVGVIEPNLLMILYFCTASIQ